MARERTGGCQCGAVRYRIVGPPLTFYLCHCKECQKQAAGAFGMSLWVARKDFDLTSGRPKFWERGADSGGSVVCAFCGTCGSRLYHASDHESDTISVKAGSLDDLTGLTPIGHIWTKSAQPWVPLAALPGDLRHETEPARFDAYVGLWSSVQKGRGSEDK
jgi:hypothetical protein